MAFQSVLFYGVYFEFGVQLEFYRRGIPSKGSLKGSFKGSIRMTIRGSGSRVQGFFLSGSGCSDSGAFGVSSSVYGSTSRLEASKP